MARNARNAASLTMFPSARRIGGYFAIAREGALSNFPAPLQIRRGVARVSQVQAWITARGLARRRSCDPISMVEEIARVKGQKARRFDGERSVFASVCACARAYGACAVRVHQHTRPEPSACLPV